MKKLGIYGDSWVNPAYVYINTDAKPGPIHECWSYHPILRDKFDVTIHSTRGQDFYSTYSVFKKTHMNFDRIVFVVTDSLRTSFEIYGKSFLITPKDIETDFENNKADAELHIKDAKKLEEVVRLLNSLKNYYLYINRDEFMDAGVARLVEEIKMIRPDAEIFPAFHNRFIPGFKLIEIASYESTTLGVDKNLHEFIDLRHAHMTKENNEIFAKIVRRGLEGEKIELYLDMFQKPSIDERNKYFIPINNGT